MPDKEALHTTFTIAFTFATFATCYDDFTINIKESVQCFSDVGAKISERAVWSGHCHACA